MDRKRSCGRRQAAAVAGRNSRRRAEKKRSTVTGIATAGRSGPKPARRLRGGMDKGADREAAAARQALTSADRGLARSMGMAADTDKAVVRDMARADMAAGKAC